MPGAKLLNTPVVLVKAAELVLFMLNVNPEVPELTEMAPVTTAQVGCVTFTVGASGAAGCAFIITVLPADIQPAAFLNLMV